MADQWLYRVFGQEFGPISFEELQTLADIGILSHSDEVRPESAARWETADSVAQLGLKTSTNIAVAIDLHSVTPAESARSDDWFCQMLGQELGPLSFRELVDYAEQGQVTADDLVKLGANGKWRRVGSIGRLVAVLPYQEQPTQVAPRSTNLGDSQEIEVPPALNTARLITPPPSSPAALAELQEAESALIKAEEACAPMVQAAHHQVSWASSPTCDPAWCVSINGVIEGPVSFAQIMEWAISGKLRPIDFLCQGRFGQYVPAAIVPGLFQAASLMKTVREALNAARSRVAAARSAISDGACVATLEVAAETSPNIATGTVSVPTVAVATKEAQSNRSESSNEDKSAKSTTVVQASVAEVNVVQAESMFAVTTPVESRVSSAGFGGSSISRPIAVPAAPRSRGSSERPSWSTMLETITSSGRNITMVAGALILIGGGWMYMSGGAAADVRRYYALKEILDEVHSMREKKSTNFAALKKKAVKVGSTTAKTLAQQQSTRPSAQFLLRAARDELPKMIYGDLSVETPAEQKFVGQLSEAANALGLKTR
ncbi:MAG: hypothetical protein JWP89_4311 [Schlesneria sp.]|nr:hypothetical protein [Schlesneria sp.]